MVSSFTFITTDPRRKAAREAVKVHVLRLRRRHRQRQGGNAKLGLVETSRGGQIHLWDSAVTEPVDLSPSASELLGSGSPGPSETFETTLPQTVTRLPLELSGPTYPFELEDMCSFPFTRMPEQSSESVLVHCYLEEDPGCGITQSWLQCFRTSEASFNAFLAVSSFRFSHERGVKPLADAAEKEIQALQAIAKQIDVSPATPTAGTMLAVALLANLQEYRGETTIAIRHWKGLKSMVEVGGGVRRLRIWEELHNFLFWLDVLICNPLATPLGQISAIDELLDHCPNTAELLSFLTQVRHHPNFSDIHRESCRDEISSPIFQILLRSSVDRTSYAVSKSSRAKLACLMYFSLLELHFHQPRAKIAIYQAIEHEVFTRGQERTIYSLELFYVILSMSNQDSLCHLIYKLSRLMNAAKKMERHDYNVCARLLSAFLGHRNPFEDVGEILSDWHELSLRMFANVECLMPVRDVPLIE